MVKLVLGDTLVNVLAVYAPHCGKADEVKESFWNEVFMKMRCVPQVTVV